MKKTLFIIAIAALTAGVMAGCGQKGSSNDNNVEQADVVDDADDGDALQAKTAEGIIRMLRQAYADASLLYAPSDDGMEAQLDLFGMYCTDELNELLRQVRANDAEKTDDDRLISDEGMIWNYWGEGEVTPEGIEVELNDDDTAQATYMLTHGDEWMQTEVSLRYVDGQWKIDDWLQRGDNGYNLSDLLNEYLENN